jgi:hypothetical protein
MLKPFQQGRLDGLCGVYALINAVHMLCGPLSKRHAQSLLRDILSFLESRGPLAVRCVEGIVIHDVAAILKHVICVRYPIVRSKPFHRRPNVDKAIYLQTLAEFLTAERTIVFSGIDGQYSHWTLIHKITEQTLQLYDSDGMRFLLKSRCSMVNDVDTQRHRLLPTHTYLLQRNT